MRASVAALALLAAACGGPRPLVSEIDVIAGPVSAADREQLESALRTLEELDRSGDLAYLRAGECGDEPIECGITMPGDGLSSKDGSDDDGADIIGDLDTSPDSTRCNDRCVAAWTRLTQVRAIRERLERESTTPGILVPFRRAVARLSPDAVPDDACHATPEAEVRAQAAVLSHLFELDPVPLTTFYAVGAHAGDVPCLSVPTLSGHVPIEAVRSLRGLPEPPSHTNRVAVIGLSMSGGSRELGGSRGRFEHVVAEEVAFFCGELCGGGDQYMVGFFGGYWQVVEVIGSWVS
ncbi:MAG: hypothetical protein AB7S26_14960 [Sandaracinaceae bacterium]